MNIDQLIKTTSKYDTPTMCNAMDVILGTRSAIGFTKSSMVTAQNSTQPIVGFAKTAKIRASSPPLISQKEINNIRMEYYEYIVKNEETGKYEEVEVGPAIFRPRFYDVNNAWINNPENRGKGYGKEIYRAFIDKAVEYSRSSGGVFIGAHYCTIGSGTSEDAKRVWASLAREYNSSGDVIFIGL